MQRKHVAFIIVGLVANLLLQPGYQKPDPQMNNKTTSSTVSSPVPTEFVPHESLPRVSRSRRLAVNVTPRDTNVSIKPKTEVNRYNYDSRLSLAFDRMANCESGGNPKALNPSGKYRGAYQFDLTTWHEIGMSGDPIDYSYEAQKAAAIKLYHKSGRGRWPECGRYLP